MIDFPAARRMMVDGQVRTADVTDPRLLSAMLVLHWSGTAINLMILAGFAVALGEVVADAIIDKLGVRV